MIRGASGLVYIELVTCRNADLSGTGDRTSHKAVVGDPRGATTMGKFFRRVAAAAATFALGWAALGVATPAAAAAGCKTYFTSYNTVKAGTRGVQATAAQCLLRRAKRPVRADGSFSGADAAQLKQFQRSVGLARTGVVNDPTWTALIAYGSRPSLGAGDRSGSVTRLQRALRVAGYTSLIGTGFYGTKTVSAVKAVQRGNGLKPTGTVGPKFWQLLQKGRLKPGKKTAKPAAAPARGSNKGAIALAFAKKQLGDGYAYGGTGPSRWDCSGLTQGAYRAAGVKLPHSSRGQMRYGKAVSKANLRPGDLVFFYSPVSHVAIYAGGGKVIHASRPGKPVGYIKMSYMPFAGARRIG
jgi:cell wall-associated NlpC family hydrolase